MDMFTGLTGKTTKINCMQTALIASLTAFVLTGCATTPAPEVIQPKPTAKRVVIITPGCTPIGDRLYCQWIEPPAVEAADSESGAGSQRLNGIVL